MKNTTRSCRLCRERLELDQFPESGDRICFVCQEKKRDYGRQSYKNPDKSAMDLYYTAYEKFGLEWFDPADLVTPIRYPLKEVLRCLKWLKKHKEIVPMYILEREDGKVKISQIRYDKERVERERARYWNK